MPFLVGLVHREAWSILVVAAPRLRTIRKKEWESKRNILAEVTPLLVSHLGIILGDSTLSEKNLWAMLAAFNLE